MDETPERGSKTKEMTTTKIDREFRIRYVTNDDRVSRMITARQYVDLIGCQDLAYRHFYRALNSGLDKFKVKLRRGLEVDFYSR